MTFLTWATDALLTKNAYCMASMEEKKTPETESYEGQSEEQVALLLEDEPEIVGQNQYNDPSDEGTLIHPMSGQPVQDEMQMLEALATYQLLGQEPQLQFKQLFDIQLKRVKTKKRLRLRVLPPERCKVGEDTPSFAIDEDCNYFEFWDTTTISDLRKEGHEVDDDISTDSYGETLEAQARDEAFNSVMEIDTTDPSMRQVTARHIWIRHDYDEDGIAELQYVLLVGTEILVREEVSTIPVACIVPFINTHRHIGLSIADLVFDIQRIKTALLRGGLDSLYLSVNPRHQVSDKVSIDDMLVSTPGALVRIEDGGLPGEGHILPLQTEFVLPQAQAGLMHMDSVTEARAGVTRQFQGLDASANNDHNRIGQLSTMASQRIELIARIMANGVERLFSLSHELIIKSGHQGEALKLRGEWTDIDPSQWKTGRDMRVVAPFAAGNKDSLLQRLFMVAQLQEKMALAGVSSVDEKNIYNMGMEIAAAADISGNKFFTNPDTVEPKPQGPDHTMIALEVENKKADNQAQKTETDAAVDKYQTDRSVDIDKYRADLQSQTQLALAQIKAGEAVDLEQFRASLKNAPVELGNDAIKATGDAVMQLNQQVAESIGQVQEALSELQSASTAPIKVVRKKGKIVGKEVGGQFVPIEDVK